MIAKTLAVLGAALILAPGVVCYPGHARAASRVVASASLPPPNSATTIPEVEDGRVEPFDILSVSVLNLDEMSRSVEVGSSGMITLPVAGDFNVAGKTTNEIAADIAARLARHDLQNPQVTVMLQDASSANVSLRDTARRGFTVEGSVTQPGVYAIYGPTTLLQGLAMAHGTDQYANEKKVMLFRQVDGRNRQALYNLSDVRQGKVEDPRIYPKDLIVVGSSKGKHFVRDVAPILPLLYLFPKP